MLISSCERLKALLRQAVEENFADALLLSGGLDSSILASILNPNKSLTVGLGIQAPDLKFARLIATKYSLNHIEIILCNEELLKIAEQIIKIFKTFDPVEIRNSSVVLAAVIRAKKDGISRIMTGDGADELFAGYNYLRRYFEDRERLDIELRHLWKIMDFSSKELGRKFGLEIKTPFLHEDFMRYAQSINSVWKIGDYSGMKWGKFILRRCFEKEIGKEIAWRSKLAQEEGAGTTFIKKLIAEELDDITFGKESTRALGEGVQIRDKEHLYYYMIYRHFFSAPREEKSYSFRCPKCKGSLLSSCRFCRICGSFPIIPF